MALRFSRLDRKTIRRLKPGGKITEHGITAEQLTNGDVRYSVNIMVDGQRIHRVIGKESEGVTRTQCEEFIEGKRTEAREDRLSLPKSRKTYLKFSKAADDYIQCQKDLGGKNIPTKERQLKLYLKPFFRDQRIDVISTFTVDRYKKRRQEAGASYGTINASFSFLSLVFRFRER